MGEMESAYQQINDQQRRFVDFLCSLSYGNKADAARRAGYMSPGVDGYRLCRDPKVKAAIAERLRELLPAPEELLAELDLFRQNPLARYYRRVTSQREP